MRGILQERNKKGLRLQRRVVFGQNLTLHKSMMRHFVLVVVLLLSRNVGLAFTPSIVDTDRAARQERQLLSKLYESQAEKHLEELRRDFQEMKKKLKTSPDEVRKRKKNQSNRAKRGERNYQGKMGKESSWK